jgi:hypothetical protein
MGLLDALLWLAAFGYMWRMWQAGRRFASKQDQLRGALQARRLNLADLGAPPWLLDKSNKYLWQPLIIFGTSYAGIRLLTRPPLETFLYMGLLLFIAAGAVIDGYGMNRAAQMYDAFIQEVTMRERTEARTISAHATAATERRATNEGQHRDYREDENDFRDEDYPGDENHSYR